jgi:hypothetical protein
VLAVGVGTAHSCAVALWCWHPQPGTLPGAADRSCERRQPAAGRLCAAPLQRATCIARGAEPLASCWELVHMLRDSPHGADGGAMTVE